METNATQETTQIRTVSPSAIPTHIDGRKIEFWDWRESETLAHKTVAEAVEAYRDHEHPAPLPETITVSGYARMQLPTAKSLADDVLEHIMQRLDEDFAGDDASDISDKLNAAALAFAEVLRAEYDVWLCEVVVEADVRVADFLKPAEVPTHV